MLRLVGLGKSYPGFRLRVSLEVEAGQTLALLGPSGSGKSTLLRLIAGLEAPEVGEIWLDGSEITFLAPERAGWGWCFRIMPCFRICRSGKT